MVCVIECMKCKIQYMYMYVGETENVLHIRVNGHCSDIKYRRVENWWRLATSFHKSLLEDLSIFVPEKIHREDISSRKAKESYWIQTL